MHAPLVSLLLLTFAAPPGDAPLPSASTLEPAVVFRGQSPAYYDGANPFMYPAVYASGIDESVPMMAQAAPGPPAGGFGDGIIIDPGATGPMPGTPAPIAPVPAGPMTGPVPGGPIYSPGPGGMMPGGGLPVYADEAYDPGGFYVGYESVIIKPFFTSDPAYTSHQTVTNSPNTFQATNSYDWGFNYSPRVWVGWSSASGFGVQARYFQFNHDINMNVGNPALSGGTTTITDPSGTIFPGPVQGSDQRLWTTRGLNLRTADLEGVWRRNLSIGSVIITGGFRYARIDQSYAASVVPASSSSLISQFASSQTFEGWGPTISMLGRRRLGMTNFALFVSGRGSLLYGDRRAQTQSSGSTINCPCDPLALVAPVPVSYTNTQTDSLVPVTEFQAGGEWWTRSCILGDSRLFLRLALEGQMWWNAGAAVPQSSGGVLNVGDLGFFGLTAGSGLTY